MVSMNQVIKIDTSGVAHIDAIEEVKAVPAATATSTASSDASPAKVEQAQPAPAKSQPLWERLYNGQRRNTVINRRPNEHPCHDKWWGPAKSSVKIRPTSK